MPVLKSSSVKIMSSELEITCPICLFIARDDVDFKSIQDNEACSECFNNFRYSMGKKWEAGIRPTTKEAREKMHYYTYN